MICFMPQMNNSEPNALCELYKSEHSAHMLELLNICLSEHWAVLEP